MVVVLPNYGADLGQALGQIGTGILDIINPNRQFEMQMRNVLATKPELVQQLADMEKNAPGSLQAMGFGKLTDIISATPMSTAGIIGNAQRGAVQGALENPEVISDMGLQATTGQTGAQRVTSANEARSSTVKANVAEAQEPGAIATAQVDEVTMKKAFQMFQDGPEVTMQKFRNNEYTPLELNAIFSTPMGQALKLQFDQENERYRLSIMKDSKSDAIERLKMNNAFDFLMKTNTNNLDAAYAFLYTPGAQTKAAELAKKPYDKLTPDEKGLVDAYNGINRLNTAQRNEQLKRSNLDLTSLLTSFRNIKPGAVNDEQREAIVNNINESLSERAGYGGEKFTASFEKVQRGAFGFDKALDLAKQDRRELVIRNAEGKVVGENTIYTSNARPKDSIDKAIEDINAPGVDKAGALKRLQSINPDIYQQVLKRMGEKKQ